MYFPLIVLNPDNECCLMKAGWLDGLECSGAAMSWDQQQAYVYETPQVVEKYWPDAFILTQYNWVHIQLK